MTTEEEAKSSTEHSPSLDDDLLIGLSNLSVTRTEPESPSQSSTQQQVRLALLQPLAQPAMLAASRDPSSKIVRFPDGRASDSSGPEFLDLSALRKAWGQTVKKLLPLSRIAFDLRLPRPPDGSEAAFSPKLYWDTATPSSPGRHHLALRTPDVMRMAVGLATVTRMRVPGEVRFELVYDESDGVADRAMKSLEKQLRAIADSGSTGLTGAQQAIPV